MTWFLWCDVEVKAFVPPVTKGYYGRCTSCYDPVVVLVSASDLENQETMYRLRCKAWARRSMLRFVKPGRKDAYGPCKPE